MKSFLEEYGFAILAAIVVILLIAMSSPIGNVIKKQTMNLVNKFSNSADNKLSSENGEVSVVLTDNFDLIITSPSTTDKFEYIVHYQDGGVDKQSNQLKYEDGFKLPESIDKNSPLYVEVINLGTNEHYISNTLTTPSDPIIKVSTGDIIIINNRRYIVLQNKGSNQYLVMDQDGIGNKQFNIDRNGQDPNKCGYINGSWKYETCNNQYENSNIDVDLNETYYNSLSFKDAIVEQDIQQNFYQHTWSNPNYKWVESNKPLNPGNCTGWCVKQPDGTWIQWNKHTPIKGEPGAYKFTNKGSKRQNGYQASVIKRKVFLPSINEVSSIVNVNDQWEMDKFLRNLSGGRLHMWFRDSRFEGSSFAMDGNYSLRSLDSDHVRNTLITARPTFVIELSKVEFTNTNETFIS